MSYAKRQRVERAVSHVSKASFVQSMLYAVSDSLASDSEFGQNPANKIRRQVEAIADGVTAGGETKEGRAVLEARFSLGHDDGQYLSQAVSLLWAGDGGERLRVVPAEMMPQIMRSASAVGLVKAMDSVIAHRGLRGDAQIGASLGLAAFLLEMKEVRDAVVDYMKNMPVDVRQAAEQIEEHYAGQQGNAAKGRAHMFEYGDKSAENSEVVLEAVFEALYVLLDVSSMPGKTFSRLLSSVQFLVSSTAKETALVVELARVLGKQDQATALDTFELDTWWARQEPEPSGICPEYGPDGVETFDFSDYSTWPTTQVLKCSVSEAFDRIAANNYSLGAETGSNVTARAFETTDKKEWNLQRIVSPMWNQGDADGFFGSRVDGSGGWYSYVGPDVSLTEAFIRVEPLLDTGASRLFSVESTQLRHDRLSQDTLFVDFAMIRGLCGYRGPHEVRVEGDELEYNFPENSIKDYQRGDFVAADEVDLAAQDQKEIMQRQTLLYSKGMRVKLNTDFVGHALHEKRRAPKGNDDTLEFGAEPAMPARWAPINNNKNAKSDEIVYDEMAHSLCEASTLEFMIRSLDMHARAAEFKDQLAEARVLRATAAVAKLHQMSSIIYCRSRKAQAHTSAILTPSAAKDVQYVTRAGHQCAPCDPAAGDVLTVESLHLPVDVGIARFVPSDPSKARGPLKIQATEGTEGYLRSSPQAGVLAGDRMVQNVQLNKGLRESVLGGIVKEDGSARTLSNSQKRHWGLEIGCDAQHEPVDASQQQYGGFHSGSAASRLLDADFRISSMLNVVKIGLVAVKEREQLQHEAAYVEKMQKSGTLENTNILGLGQTVESASRDRRASVWSDALREVAISSDRLYRFVTLLTGSIGEAADAAISWEDEDMKSSQKEAMQRQKALAERVSRFQTKLVESVVSSTLKSSKLQLDMRSDKGAADQLVVMSSEVRENVRQITSGEAGHGFFETSVELGNVLGTASRPMAVSELVRQLQSVSEAFHDQISAEMAASGPASYSRIVEPRNSYMLHLKPDTTAAIQKAFDHITTELRHCYGSHRHIHLWEFVEGKDQTLVARFAELVGLMLQNTRMRSGSFAAYVGQSQLIANGQNIRMQIQRLRLQACQYLMHVGDTPQFLSSLGRTLYFGGSVKPHGLKERTAVAKRVQRRSQISDFGGDEGDDRFDDASFKPLYKYRPETERRMRQYSRQKRAQLQAAVAQGATTQSLSSRIVSNFGEATARLAGITPDSVHPITGSSYGNTAATLFHMLVELVDTPEKARNALIAAPLLLRSEARGASFVTGSVCPPNLIQQWGEFSLRSIVCKELDKMGLDVVKDGKNGYQYSLPTAKRFIDLPGKGQAQECYVLTIDISNVQTPLTVKNGDRTDTQQIVENVQNIIDEMIHMTTPPRRRIGEKQSYKSWTPHPSWTTFGQRQHQHEWVRLVDPNDKNFQQFTRGMKRTVGAATSTTGLATAVTLAAVSALAFNYQGGVGEVPRAPQGASVGAFSVPQPGPAPLTNIEQPAHYTLGLQLLEEAKQRLAGRPLYNPGMSPRVEDATYVFNWDNTNTTDASAEDVKEYEDLSEAVEEMRAGKEVSNPVVKRQLYETVNSYESVGTRSLAEFHSELYKLVSENTWQPALIRMIEPMWNYKNAMTESTGVVPKKQLERMVKEYLKDKKVVPSLPSSDEQWAAWKKRTDDLSNKLRDVFSGEPFEGSLAEETQRNKKLQEARYQALGWRNEGKNVADILTWLGKEANEADIESGYLYAVMTNEEREKLDDVVHHMFISRRDAIVGKIKDQSDMFSYQLAQASKVFQEMLSNVEDREQRISLSTDERLAVRNGDINAFYTVFLKLLKLQWERSKAEASGSS